MMVISAFDSVGDSVENRIPGIVVVDPRFDAYSALATSARMGRLDLHMRSSGAGALKLVDRIQVDAWLIANELDDMSGEDFVGLLQARSGDVKVAMVDEAVKGSRQFTLAEQAAREAGVDMVLSTPITVADLEELLGLPIEERRRRFAAPGRSWATVPVSVGAAMIAIAVLMIG